MTTSAVETLLQFADHPQPRFVDAAEQGGKATLLVNALEPPATTDALAWLCEALRTPSHLLLELYARSNGMRLFADKDDQDTCFFFLPIELMEREKAGVADWLEIGEDPDDEPDDESDPSEIYGTPSFWPNAVVFAGFGYAPERLFLAMDGPFQGQVFCHEHDGGYTHRVAMSIDELLGMLTSDPAAFMRKHYGVGYYDVERYEAG